MPRKQENTVIAVMQYLRPDPHHFRPPISPYCNPFAYYVWSTVEQETNKTPCETTGELNATIMTAFTKLDEDNNQKRCSIFRSRVEFVLEANGNVVCLAQHLMLKLYFEFFISQMKRSRYLIPFYVAIFRCYSLFKLYIFPPRYLN